MRKITVIITLVLIISGCAESVTLAEASKLDTVGFWHGLWHGLIAPISFVISIFNNNVAIYAIYNNGLWYDFGFVIGILTTVNVQFDL